MKVFYRVSPWLSTNPNPLGNDKFEIIKCCYESFSAARDNSEVTFILDTIPSSWLWLFSDEEIVRVNMVGNEGTFHLQLELASALGSDEKVFFIEDDYLWKPNALSEIEKALDELSIVSPYDHPAHYTDMKFKYEPRQLRLIDNQVYRNAPSNTLTFATKAGLIAKNLEFIKTFGVRDHELFTSLNIDLWVPVPSLATHLVTGLLAPNSIWL